MIKNKIAFKVQNKSAGILEKIRTANPLNKLPRKFRIGIVVTAALLLTGGGAYYVGYQQAQNNKAVNDKNNSGLIARNPREEAIVNGITNSGRTNVFRGKVTKVEGNKITVVETDGKTQELEVLDSLIITDKEGKRVQLSGITIGVEASIYTISQKDGSLRINRIRLR